jgi:secreted trypsin-like serine protease
LLKRLAVVLAIMCALAVNAVPAYAITDGSLDNGAHPYVGLMVAQAADSRPLWRCSGTLISPTIFVTAGHCTEAPAAKAVIYFTDVVVSGTGGTAPNICTTGRVGYPCNGGSTGTTYTHPDYDPSAFFVRDMGIVVLDAAAPGITSFGSLPGLDSLDALKVTSHTTFTSVGYGLQKSFPDAAAWKDVALKQRMVSHPQLVQINGGIVGDFSLLLSNNANTGGTCFGDSGGANFVGSGRTLAGVTSFGLNSTCGGTGGIFRLDRSWSLAFAASH